MSCHDVRALFSDWADEVLTADARARVDAHLAQCPDCRDELERFTATIALLHRMERPRAPVGFVDRVLLARQPAPWYRRILRRFFVPLSVKVPAEAAALLLVAGLAVHVFQRTPELQQAARQGTLEPAPRAGSPVSAPPPLPGSASPVEEGLRRSFGNKAIGDKATQSENERERTLNLARDDAGRSASTEAGTSAQRAAHSRTSTPSSSPVQPSTDLRRQTEAQAVTPSGPEPPASPARPAPAEEAERTAAPPGPPAGAAKPAQHDEPGAEVKKEAKMRTLAAPRAPVPIAPEARQAAPAQGGRADSARDTPPPSPAQVAPPLPSTARVLPSVDVTGRLTVRDRLAAEQSLGALLTRSGGAVISRREDGRSTLVEVTVPRTAYPEFRQGLTGLGTWRPEGETSELPSDVRITLRLVE